MKIKFLGLIVLLAAVFMLTSCSGSAAAQTQPSHSGPADGMAPAPEQYEPARQEQEPEPEFMAVRSATVQYGRAGILKDNNGPLFAYIRYPIADGFGDWRIWEWAVETYQNAQEEIRVLREEDESAEGELNIQFDSYLVNNRFAGIAFQGMFMSSALAHPVDIIKTFNLDLENGVFLENSDILDFSRADEILSLLGAKIAEAYPDAGGFIGDIDESWLTHMVLGNDGIYVMLERAAALPGYIGSLNILLRYDELDFALLNGKEPLPEPEPEPTPSPEPIIPTAPPQSGDIDPSRPMAALTFDDGPSRYTLQILDLLERYGARATFFVIGNLVEAKSDIVVQASDSGHEILGHSWDHSNLVNLSADEIREQLLSTASVIEAVTGTRPHSFRPPYGSVNDTLKSVSRELGFGIINWSVDTLDWQSRNADAVFDAVMSGVGDRAIILCHDLYESTAAAMERVIPELISRGYQLVTISELLYYSGIELEAGRVVYSGN